MVKIKLTSDPVVAGVCQAAAGNSAQENVISNSKSSIESCRQSKHLSPCGTSTSGPSVAATDSLPIVGWILVLIEDFPETCSDLFAASCAIIKWDLDGTVNLRIPPPTRLRRC